MITIDGTSYDIPVLSVKRKADFLDKYAERVETGTIKRELIGVYFNYVLAFGRTTDTAEYAALWAKLTEPVPFHTVVVPDEGGAFTFTAYFAQVSDELRKETQTANFWKDLTVHFIAKEPARAPA